VIDAVAGRFRLIPAVPETVAGRREGVGKCRCGRREVRELQLPSVMTMRFLM